MLGPPQRTRGDPVKTQVALISALLNAAVMSIAATSNQVRQSLFGSPVDDIGWVAIAIGGSTRTNFC